MEIKLQFGVSGGPDSICLLNILEKLNYNIIVAHVNDGLRKNAIDDELKARIDAYYDQYGVK